MRKIGVVSTMDEHTKTDESPKVRELPKMDEKTRARYEAWKRNRIKKRIIIPGMGVLSVFILLILVIVVHGDGESVDGNGEIIDELVISKSMIKVEPEDELPPSESGPIVYLFNAHPLEMIGSYYDNMFEGDMNIVELTHILADHLESYGISTLVEERCVHAKLNENGWEFHMSYYAARYFLLDVVDQYPSLGFFIDLHRDGIPHEQATVEIEGANYAQILFVIGTDNPNGYEASYAEARKLHDMLEERKPNISRGIFFSGDSPSRDGVYSQDISPKVQLIEIGTITTTVEEANRTVEVLADVLAEYVSLNEDFLSY